MYLENLDVTYTSRRQKLNERYSLEASREVQNNFSTTEEGVTEKSNEGKSILRR